MSGADFPDTAKVDRFGQIAIDDVANLAWQTKEMEARIGL